MLNINTAFGNNVIRALRLAIGVIGGYLFTNSFIAMVGAGLPHLGVPQSEALLLAIILGLLAYLAVIIWVIAAPRLILVASVILGLTILMFGASLMLV